MTGAMPDHGDWWVLAGPTAGRTLTTVAEVVVGFVEPVFAGGIEDVEINGVFDGPGFVGQVGRDAQDFAGADDDFAAIDGKFQGAFEDVGYLLVVVVMQRDVRAFLQQHARQHDFVADDHFAVDERIQLLTLDVFPYDMLRLRRGAQSASPAAA
jgi:hypothetical protein